MTTALKVSTTLVWCAMGVVACTGGALYPVTQPDERDSTPENGTDTATDPGPSDTGSDTARESETESESLTADSDDSDPSTGYIDSERCQCVPPSVCEEHEGEMVLDRPCEEGSVCCRASCTGGPLGFCVDPGEDACYDDGWFLHGRDLRHCPDANQRCCSGLEVDCHFVGACVPREEAEAYCLSYGGMTGRGCPGDMACCVGIYPRPASDF